MQNGIARILHDFAQALDARGECDRAKEVFAESRNLRNELGLAPFGPDQEVG
jgi:hypothetical protein